MTCRTHYRSENCHQFHISLLQPNKKEG
jgi:hypothetical protein